MWYWRGGGGGGGGGGLLSFSKHLVCPEIKVQESKLGIFFIISIQ